MQEICERKRGMIFWELLGGIALVVVIAGVIVNLPDIKRYIEISRM